MFRSILTFTAVLAISLPAMAQTMVSSSANGGVLVVCESQNNTRENCRVDTRGGVVINQQLSKNACVRGKSWGYTEGSIWVTDGCRAEFQVGGTLVQRTFVPLDQLVTCQSIDGRTTRCPADTSAGVRVVRQLSDSSCRFGRDWGYDVNGVWVANGCRAEFVARGLEPSVRRVVCESVDGSTMRCATSTPFGVQVARQLSDSACVFNRTWGYDAEGIWVSGGCRAEFDVGLVPGTMVSSVVTTAPVPASPTILCESQDGRRTRCSASTANGIRLIRQISDSDCQLNRTWGYDREGIWVSGGCRAEFGVGGGVPYDSVNPRGNAASVVCESVDGKRNICPADTRMGVAVVRQISDKNCILNSTWGYNSDGIWVTAGCRAEFILRR